MAMAATSFYTQHSPMHRYSLPIPSPSCSSPLPSSSCLRPGELLIVRNSKAEGPLRRPSAPIKEAVPTPPSTIPVPSPPSPPSSLSSPPTPAVPPSLRSSAASPAAYGVTIEYQRQKAKELQEYFLDKKYEEQASKGRIFGWVLKNEISNGRWAMFGFAVGLLTEYATGSDFVEQLKIILSNLGIVDID